MPERKRRKQAKRYRSPGNRKGYLPPKPYKSWYEFDIARNLKESGVDFTYEREWVVYTEPAQTRKYKPDFFIENSHVIVEAKGRWEAQDRKKISLVIEQNPHLDLRMLFHTDNKISPRSKTRYSDWCKKRNITYAIGKVVPKEWLQ